MKKDELTCGRKSFLGKLIGKGMALGLGDPLPEQGRKHLSCCKGLGEFSQVKRLWRWEEELEMPEGRVQL